jgi:hypothetical protein
MLLKSKAPPIPSNTDIAAEDDATKKSQAKSKKNAKDAEKDNGSANTTDADQALKMKRQKKNQAESNNTSSMMLTR